MYLALRRLFLLCAIVLTAYLPEAWALEVPLTSEGGVFVAPVKINGVLTLDFVVDSGAAEVTVPVDVALTLLRSHTIQANDFLPGHVLVTADGSRLYSYRFIIRDLEIGGQAVHDVPASITPASGALLLGQSFLGRFSSWSINNHKHALLLGEEVQHTETPVMLSMPSANPVAKVEVPTDGQAVGRVVYVSGTLPAQQQAIRYFLVIQSAEAKFGQKLYPQGEVMADANGKWTIRSIFATPDYSYRTFLVKTSLPETTAMLLDEKARRYGMKVLPANVSIASNIVTVVRK